MIMAAGVLAFSSCKSQVKSGSGEGKATPESMWDNYHVGEVKFINQSPETKGAQIYGHIIPNPEEYIAQSARKVLHTLYFSPEDSIPGIQKIEYTLKDYEGISAKGGGVPNVNIVYSTRWVESAFGENDTAKLDHETKGVLYHELTHAFQLEPQGIGSYGTNKVFWSFIEGTADAVRYLNGCFTLEDRPKGGNYMDGYRTTGFFFGWLTKTKDPDFLRKMNKSTLEIVPWSYDAAIKHVLGEKYNIDELWNEYMVAMGDEVQKS